MCELKKCPCGGEAKWSDYHEGVLICEGCGISTPITGDKREAIRIWNNRVAEVSKAKFQRGQEVWCALTEEGNYKRCEHCGALSPVGIKAKIIDVMTITINDVTKNLYNIELITDKHMDLLVTNVREPYIFETKQECEMICKAWATYEATQEGKEDELFM